MIIQGCVACQKIQQYFNSLEEGVRQVLSASSGSWSLSSGPWATGGPLEVRGHGLLGMAVTSELGSLPPFLDFPPLPHLDLLLLNSLFLPQLSCPRLDPACKSTAV